MFATRLNPTKPPAKHRAILERVGAACREFRAAEQAGPAATHTNQHLISCFAKHGVLGIGIDPKYGGSGTDPLLGAMAAERIGRDGLGACSLFAIHSGLVASLICQRGTVAQKARYLPKAARGECLFGFGQVDSRSGENRSETVRCTRLPDGHLLDGCIETLFNGMETRAILVLVKTPDALAGPHRSAFLVDRDTPGLDVLAPTGKSSAAGVDWRLRFTKCVLPRDAEICGAGVPPAGPVQASRLHHKRPESTDSPANAWDAAFAAIRMARLFMAAGTVGALADCLELTATYIADQPESRATQACSGAIAAHIARCATDLESTRALVYAAAELRAEFDRRPTSEHLRLESSTLIDEASYAARLSAERMEHCAATLSVGDGNLLSILPPRHRADTTAIMRFADATDLEQSIARFYLFL